MTDTPIVESGMTFGPYPADHLFHVEASRTYSQLGEGVQIAEFLVIPSAKNKPCVWVVEAKSSSPRPETQPNFKEFIGEIKDKLCNALWLGLAMYLNRHATSAELPQPYRELDLSTVDFRFVLVVNGHQKEWLPPLQEALSRALQAVLKTWAISPSGVVVLNEVLAKKHGLVNCG